MAVKPEPLRTNSLNAEREAQARFEMRVKTTLGLIMPRKRIVVRENDRGMWYFKFATGEVGYCRTLNGRPLSDDEILYLIMHEAGHGMFTDAWTNPSDIRPDETQGFNTYVNAAEDVRMERVVCEHYAGYDSIRRLAVPRIMRERLTLFANRYQDASHPDFNLDEALWVYSMCDEYDVPSYFAPEVDKAWYDTRHWWLMSRTAPDCQTLTNIIHNVWRYLHPELPPMPEPPGEGEQGEGEQGETPEGETPPPGEGAEGEPCEGGEPAEGEPPTEPPPSETGGGEGGTGEGGSGEAETPPETEGETTEGESTPEGGETPEPPEGGEGERGEGETTETGQGEATEAESAEGEGESQGGEGESPEGESTEGEGGETTEGESGEQGEGETTEGNGGESQSGSASETGESGETGETPATSGEQGESTSEGETGESQGEGESGESETGEAGEGDSKGDTPGTGTGTGHEQGETKGDTSELGETETEPTESVQPENEPTPVWTETEEERGEYTNPTQNDERASECIDRWPDAKNKGLIANLTRQIQAMLKDSDSRTLDKNQRRGRLNSKQAYRVKTGRLDVFESKRFPDTPRYKLFIGLDVSGSMSAAYVPGRGYQNTRSRSGVAYGTRTSDRAWEAMVNITEAWARLKLPYDVIGWSTAIDYVLNENSDKVDRAIAFTKRFCGNHTNEGTAAKYMLRGIKRAILDGYTPLVFWITDGTPNPSDTARYIMPELIALCGEQHLYWINVSHRPEVDAPYWPNRTYIESATGLADYIRKVVSRTISRATNR